MLKGLIRSSLLLWTAWKLFRKRKSFLMRCRDLLEPKKGAESWLPFRNYLIILVRKHSMLTISHIWWVASIVVKKIFLFMIVWVVLPPKKQCFIYFMVNPISIMWNIDQKKTCGFLSNIPETYYLPSFTCKTRIFFCFFILNTSAKHHIPQGHIPNMIPNLTEITKRLLIERDILRSSSASDLHIQ